MIKTRLIRLLGHAGKYIAAQVLFQWLSLVCQIVSIFLACGLLERLLFGSLSRPDLLKALVVLAIAIALRFLFDRLSVGAAGKASLDVKRILRRKIYSKLLRLGASYRQHVSSSEVVQMAVDGVEQIEVYFGRYLGQLVYSILAPLTLFFVLFPVCHSAVVVLLVCVPLIPISIVAVQKIAKRLLSKYWGAYENLGDHFLDDLNGLTTLKIYQADGRAAEQMDAESEHFRKVTMKVLTMQLNSTSVMDIMAYGGAAVGIIVALTQFFAGHLAFAGVLTICLLASEFFIPMRVLGSFFHIAMNGMAATDKVFALLDLPEPEEGTEELREDNIGIQMEHINFSYTAERQILHEIQASFPAGSFISLVGASGCGKSTIAGILSGKNRGYHGSVRVAGKELSQIREDSLMQHIAVVEADSYLFKGTVRDNLLLANPAADDAMLQQVIQQVNLHGFLEAQDGLDTRLEEGGRNFSGGQRQRLALARALLHDPSIYIFDEATSNIDAESEEMIMQVIHRLAASKTVLLISHRLANVVDSDQIYMMQDGHIVEHGDHQALMEQGGAYSRLYRKQMELEQYGKEAV